MTTSIKTTHINRDRHAQTKAGQTFGVIRRGRLNTRIVARSGKSRLVPTKELTFA